jgi:hypothetical protein
MKNYALFSTHGRFIGYTSFKPTNGLYKELPDNFNPVEFVYVGDYETGQIKNVNELQPKEYREANVDKKWKVFETTLNKQLADVIEKNLDLPLYKQLNNIMEVLYLNKDKIQLTDNFVKMYDIITDARRNHTLSLETYKEAPKADVVTKEQELLFFEEYTQRQLNINDEPADIQVADQQ